MARFDEVEDEWVRTALKQAHGLLPYPCDGCNKLEVDHPNLDCEAYWVWSGDS